MSCNTQFAKICHKVNFACIRREFAAMNIAFVAARSWQFSTLQLTFTWSKSAIKTLEKGVEYVLS